MPNRFIPHSLFQADRSVWEAAFLIEHLKASDLRPMVLAYGISTAQIIRFHSCTGMKTCDGFQEQG